MFLTVMVLILGVIAYARTERNSTDVDADKQESKCIESKKISRTTHKNRGEIGSRLGGTSFKVLTGY